MRRRWVMRRLPPPGRPGRPERGAQRRASSSSSGLSGGEQGGLGVGSEPSAVGVGRAACRAAIRSEVISSGESCSGRFCSCLDFRATSSRRDAATSARTRATVVRSTSLIGAISCSAVSEGAVSMTQMKGQLCPSLVCSANSIPDHAPNPRCI